jgi:hypothetical protein
MRRAAAALALLALAACHDENELTVVNAGAEPVLVDISWEESDGEWVRRRDRHRFVEVPAGGIYNDDFGRVGDMDVVIYRKSDGLILFAEDYDAEDFDDDHGDVEIIVSP